MQETTKSRQTLTIARGLLSSATVLGVFFLWLDYRLGYFPKIFSSDESRLGTPEPACELPFWRWTLYIALVLLGVYFYSKAIRPSSWKAKEWVVRIGFTILTLALLFHGFWLIKDCNFSGV